MHTLWHPTCGRALTHTRLLYKLRVNGLARADSGDGEPRGDRWAGSQTAPNWVDSGVFLYHAAFIAS